MIAYKSDAEVDKLREAGRLVATALHAVREAAAPGVTLVDDLENRRYPMPRDCANRPDVFVGRVRKDLNHPCGISFWCVSDNLRKGAATNAVQIGKLLAAQLVDTSA